MYFMGWAAEMRMQPVLGAETEADRCSLITGAANQLRLQGSKIKTRIHRNSKGSSLAVRRFSNDFTVEATHWVELPREHE